MVRTVALTFLQCCGIYEWIVWLKVLHRDVSKANILYLADDATAATEVSFNKAQNKEVPLHEFTFFDGTTAERALCLYCFLVINTSASCARVQRMVRFFLLPY